MQAVTVCIHYGIDCVFSRVASCIISLMRGKSQFCVTLYLKKCLQVFGIISLCPHLNQCLSKDAKLKTLSLHLALVSPSVSPLSPLLWYINNSLLKQLMQSPPPQHSAISGLRCTVYHSGRLLKPQHNQGGGWLLGGWACGRSDAFSPRIVTPSQCSGGVNGNL